MIKKTRKNLDDAVHGVPQVSKKGGQLSPQVACLKSERFQGPWRRIGHQRIRRYLRHKHFAEERSKIVPFAAFANFYPPII